MFAGLRCLWGCYFGFCSELLFLLWWLLFVLVGVGFVGLLCSVGSVLLFIWLLGFWFSECVGFAVLVSGIMDVGELVLNVDFMGVL